MIEHQMSMQPTVGKAPSILKARSDKLYVAIMGVESIQHQMVLRKFGQRSSNMLTVRNCNGISPIMSFYTANLRRWVGRFPIVGK
ncbi:MAG: hypothetical protein R2788_05870 [Saprospiraceae bacterium]